MAAARSSGSSALISIRGCARQVAPSGCRGTYQISQPGNRRSSSRRRSPCPTLSPLDNEPDGQLPAVACLPPAHQVAVATDHSARTTCPLAWQRYRARHASGRAGQMPGSILAGPVPDPAPARRHGYQPTSAALPDCVASTPAGTQGEGERQAPAAGVGTGWTPASAPADPGGPAQHARVVAAESGNTARSPIGPGPPGLPCLTARRVRPSDAGHLT